MVNSGEGSIPDESNIQIGSIPVLAVDGYPIEGDYELSSFCAADLVDFAKSGKTPDDPELFQVMQDFQKKVGDTFTTQEGRSAMYQYLQIPQTDPAFFFNSIFGTICVLRTSENEIAGFCTYAPQNCKYAERNKEEIIEISYMIFPDISKRNLGTVMVASLVKHLVSQEDESKVRGIIARIKVNNEASVKLANRIGRRQEQLGLFFQKLWGLECQSNEFAKQIGLDKEEYLYLFMNPEHAIPIITSERSQVAA